LSELLGGRVGASEVFVYVSFDRHVGEVVKFGSLVLRSGADCELRARGGETRLTEGGQGASLHSYSPQHAYRDSTI
jgi:hypothetical protein